MRITWNSTKVISVARWDQPYVRITWAWLTLLAFEVVLAIFFTIFTIFATRRLGVPVLKSSPLAPLMVPTPELQNNLGTVLDFDQGRRQAETVHVRFEHGKLVLT